MTSSNIGDGTPRPTSPPSLPSSNELAEAGDPVARETLAQAAADLVEFVLLVRSKLRRKHAIKDELPVAWTGGVIEHMPQVRNAFFAGLKAAAPEMPVAAGVGRLPRRRTLAGTETGGKLAGRSSDAVESR